jgi:hypothetical protein
MMTGMMLLNFASRIFNLISQHMLIEKNECTYAKLTLSYLKAKKVSFNNSLPLIESFGILYLDNKVFKICFSPLLLLRVSE